MAWTTNIKGDRGRVKAHEAKDAGRRALRQQDRDEVLREFIQIGVDNDGPYTLAKELGEQH